MNDPIKELITHEINKLQTLHHLTKHRGDTRTDETRNRAVKEMAYISALGTILNRVEMEAKVFTDEKFIKQMRAFASELFLEGRDASSNTVSIASNGIGQAYLAVSKIINHEIKQL